METFIAFFDVLGFKEIVKNNSLSELRRLFNTLLRDAQSALSGEKYVIQGNAKVADLTYQNVNCLHISDSIVFWTNGQEEDDFKNLVSVCSSFYRRSLQTAFPLRGCLTHGELDFAPQTFNSDRDAKFFNYSIIGKGLVEAYLKAESIEFAGCLLDAKALARVKDELICKLIYNKTLCMRLVSYKTHKDYEHVFTPFSDGINEVSFRNRTLTIKRLFTQLSKTSLEELPESVKYKMNNTIDFISSFIINTSKE